MTDITSYKKITHKFSTYEFFALNGSIYFRFPYYKNVFWTDYLINCKETDDIKASIELKTTDHYTYSFEEHTNITVGQEYPIQWPIPSTYTYDDLHGIFLKITLPSDYTPQTFYLDIFLTGYQDLYPSVNYYILSSDYAYEFLISKFYNPETDVETGIIQRVEHQYYVQDIIEEAIQIMPR